MQDTNQKTGEKVTITLPWWGCLGCMFVGVAVVAAGVATGVKLVSLLFTALNAGLNALF